MTKFTKKKKIALVAAVLVLGTGGAAFAYWTATGTGTGSATTGASESVTVNQTSTNTGLRPGGSTALAGNLTNASTTTSYDVTAVTAAVDAFSVQADLAKPACTEADFSITGTSTNPAVVAPASTGGAWTGLTLNMANTAANQDNCKGVTVPITYTAS